VRYVGILLTAASLAACGEQAVNAGDHVEVRVVDLTGLSNLVITVSTSGQWYTQTCDGSCPPINAPTDVQTEGEAVQFHVVAGEETTDHACHVHADTIGNQDNVPTAVIYSEPLRVACQSGWQEQETES
jgi:hypothetical protein